MTKHSFNPVAKFIFIFFPWVKLQNTFYEAPEIDLRVSIVSFGAFWGMFASSAPQMEKEIPAQVV